MNDDQLDALIRESMRHDPSRSGNALRNAGPELLESIMDTTGAPEIDVTPVAAPKLKRRRGFLIAAAAAVAVAAAVVPTYLLGGNQGQAVAGSSLGLTNSPTGTRVLVDETGWSVEYAQQSAKDQWEVQLVKGGVNLQINGYASSNLDGYLKDRHVDEKNSSVEVLGKTGPLVEEGRDDWETFVDGRAGRMLDIRVQPIAKADFIDLLTRLRWVDDETWDQAMPAEVVTPGREKATAAKMLSDVPMPPGLDEKRLTPGFTNDRYQFAAHVTGAVVCRWIELDLRARADPDDKARTTADDAMASSRDWKILKELEPQGGWSQGVWEYADALTKGASIKGGKDDLTVEDTYKDALGC